MIVSHQSTDKETRMAETLFRDREAPNVDGSQEAIARWVSSVVRSRRATRAFKPLPLRRELVEDILKDAAAAPSGANIQPWRVYVVSGAVKQASHLQMAPEEVTAFGMSMGYGDHEAPVNQASMPRERTHDFARLLGFPA